MNQNNRAQVSSIPTRHVKVVLISILLLSMPVLICIRSARAALPPEVAALIAEHAPEVVGEVWSEGKKAHRRGKKWLAAYKHAKESHMTVVVITPRAGNRAEVAFRYACGFYLNTKKLRRYGVKHAFSINGKVVHTEAISPQQRSDAAVVYVDDIVPIARLKDAIKHGETEIKISYRIETRCTTTKSRYRWDANPNHSDFIVLNIERAMQKVAEKHDLFRRANVSNPDAPTRSNADTPPKRTGDATRPPPKPKAPVNIQVKQTTKGNDPVRCPGRLHFTGRIRINKAGEYDYWFLSNDDKSTTAKKLVANGAGTTDVYWNRPIGRKGDSNASGWVRLVVRTNADAGRGFYRSKKANFNVACSSG